MTSQGRDATRKKVAFILPSFAGGGAEMVVMNLLSRVDRKKFEPALIVLDAKGPRASQVPSDVTVTALEQPRLRDAVPALVRTLRAMQPAVAFSTFTHINVQLLAMRAWLGPIELIVREPNLPSANIPRLPWPWGFRKAYSVLYPKAFAVIATSALMRKELIALGVPAAIIRMLANPVDAAGVRGRAEPVIRHPGPGLRFVAVGRLSPQKGFDRLIELMAKAPADWHCTILGEGSERRALEKQIRALGVADRVRLKGFVADPAPWIAGADAFLLTSRFEGMPNSALEALALGTPVIATPESGGIIEVEGPVIAPIGPTFLSHMGAIPQKTGLQESRLPDEFKLETVAHVFDDLLVAAAASRRT